MKYRIYEMSEEGKTNYCIYAVNDYYEAYTGLRFPTRLAALERIEKIKGKNNGRLSKLQFIK